MNTVLYLNIKINIDMKNILNIINYKKIKNNRKKRKKQNTENILKSYYKRFGRIF